MFAKLAVFASLLAAAMAGSQCNTGPVRCCNTYGSTSDPSIAHQLGLLGIVLEGITGNIGADCSPITAVGTGSGSSCGSQPVCCEGNHESGLIVVGCSPVNLSL